eukprot:NODE_135_length_16508_cov_1.365897.p18 type:complete len:103 gc:universal NODE_135_length_16508_cov_1.365897:14934-14626(-)
MLSLVDMYPMTTVLGESFPSPDNCTACAIPSTKLLDTKTSANPLIPWSTILLFKSCWSFSFCFSEYTLFKSSVMITLNIIVRPRPFLICDKNDNIAGKESCS